MGALGREVWQRLISLQYGIIGCGRTGSLIATGLARLGVQKLTLIDSDVVEPHNLGEMDGVIEADLGYLKAEALRCRLVTFSHSQFVSAASVTALRALGALKPCDVLIGCVGNDAARLATGILAALYLKPLLDIGTGVFYPEVTAEDREREGVGEWEVTRQATFAHSAGLRTMGADIRFILPGNGCLLCWGGVANEAQARRILLSADAEQDFDRKRDWRNERVGSLRSLNQVAGPIALRLLEDLVGERVRGSVWLRVEFGQDGLPQLRTLHNSQTAECALCTQAGAGDEGVELIPQILNPLHHF